MRTIKIFSAIIIVFFGFCASLDFTYQSFKVGPFLLSSLVYFQPNITITLMLTLYFAIIGGIGYEYARLNGILSQLGKIHSNEQENWMLMYGTSSSFLKEFPARAITSNNRKSNQPTKFKSCCSSNIVDILMEIFIELEEFSTDVTNVFSLLIVTMFLGSFFVMTIQLYSLYKFIVEQNYKFATLTYTICWAILPSAKIFIVLYYNNFLVNEVREIPFKWHRYFVCFACFLWSYLFLFFIYIYFAMDFKILINIRMNEVFSRHLTICHKCALQNVT